MVGIAGNRTVAFLFTVRWESADQLQLYVCRMSRYCLHKIVFNNFLYIVAYSQKV